MNGPDRYRKTRFWEYVVYGLVTVGLTLVGILLFVLKLMLALFSRKGLLTLGLMVIVTLVSAAVYLGWQYNHQVDLGERTVTLIVEQGDSFGRIAGELVGTGVVDSKVMLKYPARWNGIDRKLTPGRYDFTGKNSCASVLGKFDRADVVKIKVTIPEGTTIWKMAGILAERMTFDSAFIVGLNHDTALLTELNVPCLEGFLFPETYYFPWGTGVTDVISEMVQMSTARIDSIWPESTPLDLDRFDIVKLASIIEAESSLNSERDRIASVYLNRLSRKMKLDADPTIIYGLGGLDRPLMRRDLRKDTPYNTYMYRGLPPTPINSPGLASIKAALNPEQTDFLFFVADNSGGHHFSRTNAEHNRAIRNIRSK
jgi:UPF0755 protein